MIFGYLVVAVIGGLAIALAILLHYLLQPEAGETAEARNPDA